MPRPLVSQQNYASQANNGRSSPINQQLPPTANYIQTNNGHRFSHSSSFSWSSGFINQPLYLPPQIQHAAVPVQSANQPKPSKSTSKQNFISIGSTPINPKYIPASPSPSVQPSFASLPLGQAQSVPTPGTFPVSSPDSNPGPNPMPDSSFTPELSTSPVKPLDFSKKDIEGRPQSFSRNPDTVANKTTNPAPHKIENYKVPANALNVSPAANKGGQEQLRLASSVRSSSSPVDWSGFNQGELINPAVHQLDPNQLQFDCSAQSYEFGLYADKSIGCKVYHVCFDGRRDSFVCSPGKQKHSNKKISFSFENLISITC